MQWATLNTACIVKWHIEHNSCFRGALQRAASRKQQTGGKVRLAVYCDEMTPGNPLAPDTQRKLCNWFLSSLDFEQEMFNEQNWLPIACILSSKLKVIDGGVSQAHRAIMEAAILDEHGLVQRGILLEVDGITVHVGFVFLDPAADELGHKQILDVKGASGLKPCFKCVNVFMKMHRLAGLPGNVDICEHDPSKFEAMTDSDLWAMQDELAQDAQIRPAGVPEKETLSGVNICPHGVLASPILRQHMHPVKSRFDRMHNMESNGIADLEISFLVESLSTSGKYSNHQLNEYVRAGWRVHGKNVQLTFKDDKLKGNASDVLTAMPILSHFCRTFLQDWEPEIVESFLALFESYILLR